MRSLHPGAARCTLRSKRHTPSAVGPRVREPPAGANRRHRVSVRDGAGSFRQRCAERSCEGHVGLGADLVRDHKLGRRIRIEQPAGRCVHHRGYREGLRAV